MKERPSVFVSYSQSDQAAVDRILQRLTAQFNERRDKRVIFWDQRQITPGENWAAEVSQALDRASAMLVFISPAYLSSQWSKRELEFALSSPRYEGRLIPVLLKPASEIPWILQRLSLVDATKGVETAIPLIAKALRRSSKLDSRQQEAS